MSELLLSIDTTHEIGSLALLNAGVVIEEVVMHSPEGFGHVLYGHIARLLQRHGRRVDEMARFAAAAGPGSFTGVRVGLACVKGLAEATGKTVVPVSNLAAIARFGTQPLRAVVLDARRGEVYGAVYSAEGAVVCPEVVAKFGVWRESLPESGVEFVSADFEPFRAALNGTRFDGARITTAPRAIAGAVGEIAWGRVPLDPADVDANYVRRSDAELLWKP